MFASRCAGTALIFILRGAIYTESVAVKDLGPKNTSTRDNYAIKRLPLLSHVKGGSSPTYGKYAAFYFDFVAFYFDFCVCVGGGSVVKLEVIKSTCITVISTYSREKMQNFFCMNQRQPHPAVTSHHCVR